MSRSSIFVLSVLAIFVIFITSFFALRSTFSKNTNNNTSQSSTSEKINITTSFQALNKIVSEIAGENANVVSVTPAGEEAHDFTPSANDRINIEKSDLFVFVGIDFDPWAEKISQEGRLKNFLEFSKGAKLLSDNTQKLGQETDPHIWLDPEIVKNQSKNILEKLKQIDPQNQSKYQENYQTFVQNLDSLDNKYKSELSNCKQDTVVVSHNAYAYLSNRYKFNTKSIQGLSTLDSPTTAEVAQIISLIKTEKIKYIMVEEIVSNSSVEQIKAQTKVELLELSPLESVSQENINQTYQEAMEKNLESLVVALECGILK